ncbi:sulfotransferase, partial [Synechococcus sp. AH-224-I15]|nr:sulfotransferase [Synechococcus sp. AH-224-I15]
MNKSIIIVLGMHRSGTSLIARSLGTLGVEFGDNLMPGVIDNNAKGFWEDMDVFALNEEMLATCNSNWWATETIPEKTITNLIESGFQERAVSLIEKKIKNVRFFGLKDPRISKLFKFWSEIFKKVDAEIIYIYSLRNPISIAHSLHNRDGINFFHSYMAWAEHCLTPLAGLENKKWVKIEYEKLIENAEEELKKISLITGLELNQSELAN